MLIQTPAKTQCVQKPLYLIVMLALGFTVVSSYRSCCAESINDRASIQAEPLDPFIAWDGKLKDILMAQLVDLGYDEKTMAEEALAINTKQDKDEHRKLQSAFYTKYQNLALTGLRRMAALAQSADADGIVANLEFALKAQSTLPPGDVPQGIAFIYQQIPTLVLESGSSPCLTPMTRLGCLFAFLTDKECAYVAPSAVPASSIPATWQFPSASYVLSGGSRFGGLSGWDIYGRGLQQAVSVEAVFTGDVVRSAPAAGFRWPLQSRDHTMCVEMHIESYRADLSVYPTGYVPQLSTVHTWANIGSTQETAIWSLTLNGYGGFRSGLPASDCGFVHQVSSDTFSADHWHDIPGNPSSRACWFSNLEDIYRNTITERPFPVNLSDPDTWFAATVDITSNASVSQTTSASSGGYAWVQVVMNNFGVLVLRDR